MDKATETIEAVKYYHGTKANLELGDLITPGFSSNFGAGNKAKFAYFSATLNAATWGAELALGEGNGRIYIVEPTGFFEDDPNLTDKKFSGNPTKSYRTKGQLRIVGEVFNWEGHPKDQLDTMRANVEKFRQQGIEAIEE